MIETMRKDFEYWYPFDFRNSAKDLVQNHLAFCIFNHAALFPKKHWPKAFVINGRIMVNNEKMSKSKGNFFTMRELYEKHGADIVRLAAANAGEGVDDANYDMDFLETAKRKLSEFYELAMKSYGRGRTTRLSIDRWFESKINENIRNATDSMENMLFKSAAHYSFMEMQRSLKWYLKRTSNNPNRELMNLYIESVIRLLTPFAPHFSEECWEAIGKKAFVSNENWPKADLKAIDANLDYSEELIGNTISDIRTVLKLAKIETPRKIKLVVCPSWKYELFKKINSMPETKNAGETLKEVMQDRRINEHRQEMQKFLPKMIRDRKVPRTVLTKAQELLVIKESLEFIRKEFNCEISLIDADESDEPKSRQALPGKPAIIIE
ncbi:class I tRNA ligase family protein [Candidatus Woesearchaeota archaeon]|nr:class I tRNA ligase family protein [Candidatus Woesearchaeota archaeon]